MSLLGRWPLVRGKGGCQTHYTTTFCNTSSDNHTEFMQCDVHTFIQRKSSSGASRKSPARIPRIHDAKSMAAQSASIRAICVLPQLARQQALYIMYTMCYDQRAHHLHSLVQNKDCCLLRHRRLKNKRHCIFSKMNIYGGVDLQQSRMWFITQAFTHAATRWQHGNLSQLFLANYLDASYFGLKLSSKTRYLFTLSVRAETIH